MIAAVDVYYSKNSEAVAAAVVFSSFSDTEPYSVYLSRIHEAANYIPGQFYKRELPCILSVLGKVMEEIEILIIDGYVNPGKKPGLGYHLWKALGGKVAVIGVAKTYFRGTAAVKVFRGNSLRPLYITSAGIDAAEAACLIEKMPGRFRIPDMLKLADRISRSGKNEHSGKVKSINDYL